MSKGNMMVVLTPEIAEEVKAVAVKSGLLQSHVKHILQQEIRESFAGKVGQIVKNSIFKSLEP